MYCSRLGWVDDPLWVLPRGFWHDGDTQGSCIGLYGYVDEVEDWKGYILRRGRLRRDMSYDMILNKRYDIVMIVICYEVSSVA